MKIKPNIIRVPPDNPFEYDSFKQKENVLNFANILSLSSHDSLVYSISGKWGSGKTTFLKMLKCCLKEYSIIFINAWESDFAHDPLPVLISEISNNLDINKKLKSKIKSAGKTLLKSSILNLIKILSSGYINIDKDVITSISSKVTDEIIKNYLNYKKNILKLKDILKEITKNLKSNKNELIIIIDELDRCKPDFAIRLLELLKHVFDIQNISFIIALDEIQLSESIKSVYGNGFDAIGYLRRFIDLKFLLPPPDMRSFCSNLFNNLGFNIFFNSRKNHPETMNDEEYFLNTISGLSKVYSLSLRDVEQLLIRLSIIFNSTKGNSLLYPTLLAFLLIISDYDNDIYNKIIYKNINLNEILLYFSKLYEGNKYLFDNYNYSGRILFSHLVNIVDPSYVELDNLILENKDNGELSKYYENIKRIAEKYRYRRNLDDLLEYIISKIIFSHNILTM